MAPPDEKASLSAIEKAPIDTGDIDFDPHQSRVLSDLVSRLQDENLALKTELARERGKSEWESARTGLMAPYAAKVFSFLVAYCGFVGAVILLDGFSVFGFNLNDYVLGIIAGSTAASAIGLVGFVVNGLFRSR